jgi:glycosyltransferase involved in cell wall biosynthesis
VRIAVIAPPWVPVPPPAYGGTEAVVDRLARGFRTAGHEVLLFTTGDSTCPVDRKWVLERAEGIRIGMAVPELHHLIHAYDAVQGFDVVHDHTVMGPLYAERFPDLTVVTTNHGPFNEELRTIYRAVAGRVPIIAISRSQAAAAGDIPIARVIHHGLDPQCFPVGRGDGGYLVFLGRMTPDKGADRAARVARAAGARLLIAAKMREPWEHEYFEREVRPLLGGDVEYVGEVGGQDKHDLLAGARALLNPIRWPEPFGLAMVEALACGTPVVSFPEGAAPEIVQDGVTGFLCRDEADMVSKLDLVETIDRGKCRVAVEQQFSTERMVHAHVELFEELLSRKR